MDKERVKKLVRELIIELGEDPTREGLKDTPRRIADAYGEIFSGYDSDSELSVQFSEDSEMVVAKIFNTIQCVNITCFLSLVQSKLHTFQMEESLAFQN